VKLNRMVLAFMQLIIAKLPLNEVRAMMDLNDLYLFTAVVEHKGYVGAAHALKISKSKLSRRMAALQEQLGVPLLQLSTRTFSLTPSGVRFYQRAKAVMTEAEAAQESIEMLRSEPQGTIRVASTINLAHIYLAELLPEFMRVHPKVRVVLDVANRNVDLNEERYDVALRVTPEIRDETNLMVKILTRGKMLLVASPAFLKAHKRPTRPAQLALLNTLGSIRDVGEEGISWVMKGPEGEQESVLVSPRLICRDSRVAMGAVLRGLGIALMPEALCATHIAEGKLVHVLPEWKFPEGIIHLVYPARRSQLPSVRAFIDFMVRKTHEIGSTSALPIKAKRTKL